MIPLFISTVVCCCVATEYRQEDLERNVDTAECGVGVWTRDVYILVIQQTVLYWFKQVK